jgi:hypothetical protein
MRWDVRTIAAVLLLTVTGCSGGEDALELSPSSEKVSVGSRVELRVTGDAAEVKLYVDQFPFDRLRPSPVGAAKIGDGEFRFAASPDATTRYQARAGELRSSTVTVEAVAEPLPLIVRRVGGRSQLEFSVPVPRDLSIREGPVHFYVREGGGGLSHLGQAPLRRNGDAATATLAVSGPDRGFHACLRAPAADGLAWDEIQHEKCGKPRLAPSGGG